MLKIISQTLLISCLTILVQVQAFAWEQHGLPSSYINSSTPHYGGNKAPHVLSNSHIQVVTPELSGISLWDSLNGGISWSKTPISSNPTFTHAFLTTPSLILGWGETQVPTMFHLDISSGRWGASSFAWPLANWNIFDVCATPAGDIIVLASSPAKDKLVEGELFILFGNAHGWSLPLRLSSKASLVGDAKFTSHASGLQSVVWSERSGNSWHILSRNTYDNNTWSAPITVVNHIAAPYFQEAAIQIAADSLNQNEVALAFTGWDMQPHSQIWSKAFDISTGLTTHALTLLPDAGDMVHQPSLVSLSDNTWAVAWQQSIGIDTEVLIAQHFADGTWSQAANISADPNHMDRDPHITKGSSKTLSVAFTRRIQADIQEVYMVSEGNIHDNSLDSDGDGIPDNQEQGFDFDNDGIDDALSARVATWENQDGRYALVMEGNGELQQVQAPSLTNTKVDLPSSFQISGSLFSFQIHAISIGESTSIHLITPKQLNSNVTWLKLNPNAQWADSEQNNIRLDASGTGLFIQLIDGGLGDEDGLTNGVIIDPAALATPKVHSSIEYSSKQPEVNQSCLIISAPNSPSRSLFIILLVLYLLTQPSKALRNIRSLL